MFKTKPLIEQHIHGAFGVDFNTATSDEILDLSKTLYQQGIGGFFPTLVTDTVENLKQQIATIKTATKKQNSKMARILGVHLEGVFLNPKKKGIQNEKYFLMPTPDNFKQIEDEIIKIVTLAPEQDLGLLKYLKQKGVKIQAGHCVSGNLNDCDGVTHLFNAMGEINHRETKTALSALIQDNLYTEVIADGIHLSDDILQLIFRVKPLEKILLVSDCLPIAYSNEKNVIFADEEIFYDGNKATSKSGTIAGSTTILPSIIKTLGKKGYFNIQLIENFYDYHGITTDKFIEIDDNYNISVVK